ncbi:MAG: AAA family ATPase [Gemmatimonadetes bacterium]|nr:AAA family ATPase [Gemmatimonadota bacterium]
MYEAFYGLAEKPFSLTPNPRYVFYSEHYRAALDHLLYGLNEREGFMLLTGMVGTGKTTLCRELLENLDPQHYRTALIFNPFLNGTEMLQALLTEFGCSYPAGASKKELLDRLNRFLLSQLIDGKTCVAIFDEAQHLSAEFLEQIRVLSNLETDREKLLQILLVGQPELRERIQQPSLAQLDQRVSLRCTLRDLNRQETERYVYHRLNVAGAQGRILFTDGAISKIHQESRGVPRLISLISDRTLLAGYVAQTMKLAPKQVRQGLASLRGEGGEQAGRRPADRPRRWFRGFALTVTGLALLAGLGVAAAWYAGGAP